MSQKEQRSSPKHVNKNGEHGSWFTFMLSFPLKKQMSSIELFTQWSAIMTYIPMGFLFLIIPHIMMKVFLIECGQYGNGLLRVLGAALMVIGFFFFVISRAKPPTIPSLCIILSTTFERIVIVSSCMYAIFRMQVISLPFPMAISVLDFGLATLTIVIWFCSSAEASVKNYFRNIRKVLNLKTPKLYSSSSVIKYLGIFQAVVGAFLAYARSADPILQLKNLQDHEKGLLSIVLVATSMICFISFYSSAADDLAFNIATLFYRVFFMIPLIVTIGLFHQIPLGLAAYLLCFDILHCAIISLALYIDYK